MLLLQGRKWERKLAFAKSKVKQMKGIPPFFTVIQIASAYRKE